MSPSWTAFTIRCIAGSSVGATAPFRARMAGRATSLREALALPAGSCWAAACASCAYVTASATRPGRSLRSAAGSGLLRPVPPSARHGAAGSAKRGRAWGSGREHVRQVRDGCGVLQVHVDPQEGGARGARACVPPMRRCKASSSVRLCGPAGGSG